MILTGSEIEKEVRRGRIDLSPFMPENVNPNSYNYHLSNTLLEIQDVPVDPKEPSRFKKIQLTQEGYLLLPNRLYLGSTCERIGSNYFVISLIGRSSMGRLGLFLQITADLGQLGPSHCWTLELKVVQPLIIYPRMKIGQVSFWDVVGKRSDLYKGIYRRYSQPHHSETFSIL
ncbi:MAG: hypothetical protein A2Y14_04180 [Verrucomicrobia bacterium GWF2_51_19]|nr:MAG: hypothetical protein A2Y14_04180 [Verrucomicrobia bacterium GWF2_51_19]HCJ11807.1 deoxycytidine deaminase [Opitutae bacterium]